VVAPGADAGTAPESVPASVPSAATAAATSFTLAWAIELALARITGQPQTWADMLASAALLVALPTLALIFATARGASRPLCAALASLPLAFVAAGIVIPVAVQHAGSAAAVAFGVALLALVFHQSRQGSDEPLAPSPGLVLSVLVAAAATAWVLLPSGFPPFQIHLPFLFAAVLLARLTSREYGLALVALGGVALAFWPPVLPPFPWTAAPTTAERPDILVISVDAPAAAVTAMPAFERLQASGSRYTLTNPRESDGNAMLRAIFAAPREGDTSSTLAAALGGAGYDTAAVIGAAPALDVRSGLYQGFAVYHHFIDRNRFALPRARANLVTPGTPISDFAARPIAADLLIRLGLRTPPQFAAADELFAVIAKVMSERRDNPVFLWMHFRDRIDSVNQQMRRLLDTLGGATEKPHLVVLLSAGGAPGDAAALVLGGSAGVATRLSENAAVEPAALVAFLRTVSGSR